MTDAIRYYCEKKKAELMVHWQGLSEAEIAQEKEKLNEAREMIYSMYDLARREGLLALEELTGDLFSRKEASEIEGAFKWMIELVVVGESPNIIEEMSFLRLFSDGYEGFEAALYMLYLYGILMVQSWYEDGEIRDEFDHLFSE